MNLDFSDDQKYLQDEARKFFELEFLVTKDSLSLVAEIFIAISYRG